jgi:TonB-dependent starch-binding outer membrane protein SusC
VTYLDRWQQSGDEGKFVKKLSASDYDVDYNNLLLLNTQAIYGDASYIRLKNISLSFDLPEKWLRMARISGASIYAHAQNLLTFTNYFGLDPESMSSATLPPLRVITFGIKATL